MTKLTNIRLTLEQIHEQSEKDLQIRKDELVLESIRTPTIFSKYSKILSIEKLALRKAESDLKIAYKKAWEYYSGKAEPQIYKDKPFGHKILKGNVDKYIESDDDVIAAQAKLVLQKEKVESLERILKAVNDRQWIIRNVNDTLKFENGM